MPTFWPPIFTLLRRSWSLPLAGLPSESAAGQGGAVVTPVGKTRESVR
ncbi:hypothetical protein RISK_004952 [Rhodopirellula islandica]|uniref:Uncharacterized protein n=1 Tax=Rhodopirellula islandica TaxID=595434 RepID=A0A0J1B8D3_RHOIS|nr:hypothetical protein RISK_004952 [Rhodopirellula islandica]